MEEKKLKDMLKMSLKLSDQENVELADTQIDKERAEWLRGVINKTLEEDDSRRIVIMTQYFLTLKPDAKYDDKALSELENLYEELNYLNEGFDIAKLFNSNGGMEHNLQFLQSSPHKELKIEAANLIGNSTHNNPSVQKTILENNGMEILLGYIKSSDDIQLVVKCLYALSTLISGYVDSEKRFAKIEDSTFFIKMLDKTQEKVLIKTVFLLIKLYNSEVVPIEHFVSSDLIKKLMKLLDGNQDRLHQHLLHALVPCFQKLKLVSVLPDLGGKKKVMDFFKSIQWEYKQKDKSMFESEIESCNLILDVLRSLSI